METTISSHRIRARTRHRQGSGLRDEREHRTSARRDRWETTGHVLLLRPKCRERSSARIPKNISVPRALYRQRRPLKHHRSSNNRGTDYVCPMDPEVLSRSRVRARSAGWHSNPNTRSQQRARIGVCPMHPEIVSTEPGSCPICGMALEPRVTTVDADNPRSCRDWTWRFYVAVWALRVSMLALTMGDMLLGHRLSRDAAPRFRGWLE